MSWNSSATKNEILPGHTDTIGHADRKPAINHLEDFSHSVITYQHIQIAAWEDTYFSKLQAAITYVFSTSKRQTAFRSCIKKLLESALLVH